MTVAGAARSGGELAREIDAGLHERVLVFGSPPPHGGDLDLLARAPQLRLIARWLTGEGFMRRRLTWASFNDCEVLSVDLVPAEHWGLDDDELRALFTEAEPIGGFSSLVLPAPHHQVLIAARRAARAGTLEGTSRARIETALSADCGAWRLAEERAPAWNAVQAMRLLGALRQPEGPRRALKAAARAELAVSVARTRGGRRRLRSVAPRRRRPALIALSGLDGAGKSLQAEALQKSLSRLGVETFVVWPPAQNVLFQMPPAVKRVLRAALERAGRPEPGGAARVAVASDPAVSREAAEHAANGAPAADGVEPVFAELPSQRPLVMHLLATIVALAQVLSFRRGARSASGRPRVVIFDRYVLDAIVYVRHRWGHGHLLRWQCLMIRALARRPLRAYLLDVAPEVAYARKRDFPLENLQGRAELYREQWQALGVRRLDGERPRGELCEEIAREVWSLLR